jgi:hypothetical protein
VGVILPIVVGALVAALVTTAIIRSRRRTRALPELNKHPERLEQMLDPTDDA